MGKINMMRMTPLIKNYIQVIKFKTTWIEFKRSIPIQHYLWETSAVRSNIDYFDPYSFIFSIIPNIFEFPIIYWDLFVILGDP